MLTRFAANAIRSWTRPSSQHICLRNVPNLFQSRHQTTRARNENDPSLQLKLVQKRLHAIQSALRFRLKFRENFRREFESWKYAIQVPDFSVAFEKCGDRLSSAPSWVILYLFAIKVFEPSHAVAAVNVMLQHFTNAHETVQPALVILALDFLAKQQVEAPVPNLLKLFNVLDLAEPSRQFNLFLQKLSHFRSSPLIAKVIAQVLGTMRGRQLKLYPHVYRLLLSNSLVTLELAKMLQRRMALEATQPDRRHLEAYLRVFAHHGAVHASARYLNLIRKDSQKAGKVVPHGVELSSKGVHAIKSEDSANSKWNTVFLGTFKRHTGSAFQYLQDMLEEKDLAPDMPRTARKVLRFDKGKVVLKTLARKRQTNIADWVTVLNVAARDRRIKDERLLCLFDETRGKAGFKLTVPLFTVLMRGLLKKGDHETALSVWDRCTLHWKRRRKIDTKALTVALQVIVANGDHIRAFNTLVETTGLLFDKEKPPPKIRNKQKIAQSRRRLFSKYARIDAAVVNALMDAYLKQGRCDLVFKLWDVFYPLFGVHPTAETLTIVLDAAFVVSKWDHTLHGLLERLGLTSFFRTKSIIVFRSEEKSRLQIWMHVRSFIHHGTAPSSTSGAYEDDEHEKAVHQAKKIARRTVWDGELAAPKAAKLFQEILLGNYPQLRNIEAPARAVWPDGASNMSPMRDALSSLGSRLHRFTSHSRTDPDGSSDSRPLLFGPSLCLPRKELDGTPSPVPTTPTKLVDLIPVTTSLYPQITPNAQSFAAYIHLLSSLDCASQIPITLAWMRALDIRPLKRSLARAIALWSEASMRGPLIERYGARESEFERLWFWLEKWLGKEGMPTPTAVSWAFRKLKEERVN